MFYSNGGKRSFCRLNVQFEVVALCVHLYADIFALFPMKTMLHSIKFMLIRLANCCLGITHHWLIIAVFIAILHLTWMLNYLYQTTIIPCIRLLLKVLKDINIAHRWFIFTAYDGLEGKYSAPPMLNRVFCTSQEPFQIRVAPVSVPSGKAAHLRTGTQEYD